MAGFSHSPARRAPRSHLHQSIAGNLAAQIRSTSAKGATRTTDGERNCFAPRSVLREFLKRGRYIFHMGGGELARSFLQSDLIDELSLGIVPILLGNGLPLFPGGFPQRDFRLVENKTYPKNQILLTYQRVRSKRKRK
jgi:dihydrofolate reductase